MLLCKVISSNSKIAQHLFEDLKIPLPRSGHRMVCVGHNLFIFGGYNPNLGLEHCDSYWHRTMPLFAELWQFNTISRKWRQFYQCSSDRSDSLVSFGAVVYGQFLVRIGGTGEPFGSSSHSKIQIYDLHSSATYGRWIELKTFGEMPQPVYGQGVAIDEESIYVIGGTSGFVYNMDVHKFNICTRRWEALCIENEIPIARYRHEIVLHKKELLVIGGGQKFMTAPLDILDVFSLDTLQWRVQQTLPDPVLQTFPSPRKCHITVLFNNYVYVHGGCDESASFGDMWRLDLQSWRWQQLRLPEKCQTPRYFHAASVTEDGCLYIHGGVFQDGIRSDELLQCWLTVPSLKSLAWDCMITYAPNLCESSTESLLKCGVPINVVRQCELLPDPQSEFSHTNCLLREEFFDSLENKDSTDSDDLASAITVDSDDTSESNDESDELEIDEDDVEQAEQDGSDRDEHHAQAEVDVSDSDDSPEPHVHHLAVGPDLDLGKVSSMQQQEDEVHSAYFADKICLPSERKSIAVDNGRDTTGNENEKEVFGGIGNISSEAEHRPETDTVDTAEDNKGDHENRCDDKFVCDNWPHEENCDDAFVASQPVEQCDVAFDDCPHEEDCNDAFDASQPVKQCDVAFDDWPHEENCKDYNAWPHEEVCDDAFGDCQREEQCDEAFDDCPTL